MSNQHSHDMKWWLLLTVVGAEGQHLYKYSTL